RTVEAASRMPRVGEYIYARNDGRKLCTRHNERTGMLRTMLSVIRASGNRVYRRLYGVRGAVRYGRRFHLGLGSIVWAPHSMRLGNDVYIGKMCTVECDGEIGNGVMLANNVGIIGRYDHDFRRLGKMMRHAS